MGRIRNLAKNLWILAAMGSTALAGQAEQGGLSVGDAAPAFELPGSDGQRYKLADYAEGRYVVVAWFPKAFTGG